MPTLRTHHSQWSDTSYSFSGLCDMRMHDLMENERQEQQRQHRAQCTLYDNMTTGNESTDSNNNENNCFVLFHLDKSRYYS